MNYKLKSTELKWLSEVIGKKKIYIIILLLLQSVIGIISVAYAMFLRNVIDSAVNVNHKAFSSAAASVIILVIIQILLRAVVRYIEELSRSEYENLFKQRLLGTLLKKDFASIDSVHSGEWLNRLTSDTVVCANGLTEIVPGLAGMIVKMTAALFMIIKLEPAFTYILIPGGAALVLVTYGFRKVLKKLHKNIQEKDGSLRMFLQDVLGSHLVVRTYAAAKQTENDAAEKMKEHKNARIKRNYFSNFCNIGFGSAMNGMYILGVIYGSTGIMNGTVSYGTMTALLQLIAQIKSPFANITGYLPKYFAVTASAERLMEPEKFKDDYDGEIKSYEEVCDYYVSHFKSLKLENVCYTYLSPVISNPADNETRGTLPVVLENINLEILKGQTVAFTGHSGCGKSTLLKIIMSLYRPEKGRASIVSDVDELQITPEWHKLFAYVPQGNHIMSGSVREIVAFADKTQSGDDIRIDRALEIACAAEFVAELKDGKDHVLGERGQGLSEGQIQRIAIARAIFSDSPFLILDEVTSALDEATECRLLGNIRNMTDKTVIIVTHRPGALEICDKVYDFADRLHG